MTPLTARAEPKPLAIGRISARTRDMTARQTRIPQAERRAATRGKLIDAAIACLYRTGYAATGVVQVVQEAGVSRGAMSHQYPTKADLMIEVVRVVYERERAFYVDWMGKVPPAAWLRKLPELMWEMFKRPSGLAVLEIMLAARSDAELAEKLYAIQSQIEDEAGAGLIAQFVAAKIALRPDIEAMQHLFVAAVRGLAIETVFMKSKVDGNAAIALLREIMAMLYPTLRDDAA